MSASDQTTTGPEMIRSVLQSGHGESNRGGPDQLRHIKNQSPRRGAHDAGRAAVAHDPQSAQHFSETRAPESFGECEVEHLDKREKQKRSERGGISINDQQINRPIARGQHP